MIRYAATVLFSLMAFPLWGQVAFVTSGVPFANDAGFGANQTAAFDSTATGSDRILAVSVVFENGGDPGVSAITYDGTSLTKQIEETVSPADDFSETIEIWTVVAPSTGSNTIALTNSATSQDAAVMAAVYSGVDQSTPIGNTNSVARTLTNDATLSMTKQAVDNGIHWALAHDRAAATFDPETDNVIRDTQDVPDDGTNNAGFSAAEGHMLPGSGTVSVGATQTTIDTPTTDQDLVVAGVELLAVSDTGGGYSLLQQINQRQGAQQ